MKHILKVMTVGDKILIVVLIVSTALSIVLLPAARSSGHVAVIESENGFVRRCDLSEDRIIPVSGPLGETIIEVRGGRIRVTESPCPHHLCVKAGFRDRKGDVIACIPNRVVIRIERSQNDAEIDGLTR